MNSILWIVFTLVLAAEAWVPRPPLGLDLYLPTPAANPLTRENVAIGRRLFFDKRLSFDIQVLRRPFPGPALIFMGRQDSVVRHTDAWPIVEN